MKWHMGVLFGGMFFFSACHGMDKENEMSWEKARLSFLAKKRERRRSSIEHYKKIWASKEIIIPGKGTIKKLVDKENQEVLAEMKNVPSRLDDTPVGPSHWLVDYFSRYPEKAPKPKTESKSK